MKSQRGAARTWLMTFVVLAGGGLATLVGVGCLVSANACPFRDSPKQTSTDGRILFAANCAACHGRNGEGGNGPSLVRGSPAALSAAGLESRIGRGRPLAGMPRFSRILSAIQIRAVAGFVQSLRGPSPSPAGSAS
ncbi:MAG: c-type cytochrome [Actinomycetota bacterium]